MGRTQITPENRVSNEVERFAAFKFQQNGERARIACLERQQLPDGRNVLTPWMEFVHRIETVEEKDGQPLQKMRTWKDKDGQEQSELVWATEWVGSPICLGDKAVLLEKGLDVGNCPVCRASQEYPEITQHRGLGAPTVRYSMNIIRFSTRPGGFILADPFGAQIVVWSFTEKRFNRLDDLNRKLEERGELQFRRPDGSVGVRPYDITDVDLLLGPCNDHRMQKYEIDVAEGLAMWRRSPATIQYIQQLWLGAGMRATDEQLQLACGRPVTNRNYLDSDIQKAVSGWTKALRGGPAPTVDPFGASFGGQQGQQDMAAGMGQMADELATPPVPQPPMQPQMAVPPVPQPTVQPAVPQPPVPPQVPAVPQPTVQPTPPGPMPPQTMDMPPAPPTQAQLNTMAGGHGLEQFAPPPPSPLAQAAGPDMAALQAQQQWAMQNAGVPQQMLPPPPALTAPQPPQQPFPGPMPGMTPAAPVAAPSPPASTAPPTGTYTPPAPNGQPPQAAADLFAPPPPAAPAEGALEFSDLANF